ncbi:MAG: exodeoxyribonuclease VII large subunit [Gemmatimonadetes bacterium]|nr:exodeoxyribonuclease VII large subunit [Gemmatimonadota bacterium]
MESEAQTSLFPGSGPGEPTADRSREPQEVARPDGRTRETAISVAALNGATKRLLEDRVPRLWVRGEIASWRRAASGHRYFSLRDDEAQVDCVLFQGDAWRLPADPEDGMEVTVFGQPTLFAQRGRFQLVARSLEAVGEGLWRLAFERLRRSLAADGLLAPERKRPLPRFPRRLGVVTSLHGAALRDVLTVLRRRSPWVDVLVHDCRVQGEGAAFDIRDALERMSRVEPLDAVILTRGGGSTEDLWCFNEEVAVRAVAACRVPVVCAVGHEIDVTLAELVADVRAPTPSVAAELAAPDIAGLRAGLDRQASSLERGLRRGVDQGRARLRRLRRQLPRRIERTLSDGRRRVGALSGRLDALSPLATLARGYSVATSPDGRLLSGPDAFRVGDPFRLRARGAVVGARVEEVEVVE